MDESHVNGGDEGAPGGPGSSAVRRVRRSEIPAFRRHPAFVALSERPDALAGFLRSPPGDLDGLRAQADDLKGRPGLSESLHLTLMEFNRSLGAGDRSLENLDRLARGGTPAVAALARPNPGGGPTDVFFRALTATALSRSLREKGAGEFVPLFVVDAGTPGGSDASADPAAFGALLHRRFPAWGLVLVALRLLRPEGLTLFEQEFLDPHGIRTVLEACGSRLASRGMEAPFKGADPTNLLFEEEDGTPSPVVGRGDRFFVGDREVEPFDLLSRLERLAPDTALQPLLLNMALPVACLVTGPDQAAGHIQASSLFPLFGLPLPPLFPQATGTRVQWNGPEDEAPPVPSPEDLAPSAEAWDEILARFRPSLPGELLHAMDVFDFRHHVISASPREET
jgi:uncharacterized protein YllA (UPF0747 family)